MKNKYIEKIEKIGTKLPHPIVIFCYLIVLVSLISFIFKDLSFEDITINSVISKNGILWLLSNMINNFIKYPALGTVIITSLGVGIAEETGLLKIIIKLIVKISKKEWISYIVVFVGVLGNAAGSSAFVIIPPIGAMIFQENGKNPIAGIIAAFCGVGAGLSANLLITPTDVTSSMITQEAARLLIKDIIINPTVNWYFFIVSTFLITFVVGFMIEHYVEKILNKYYKSDFNFKQEFDILYISKEEKKALINSFISLILYILIIILGFKFNILIDKNQDILQSTFLKNIVIFATLLFFIPSSVYGISIKVIKNSLDLIKMMTKSIENLSSFILMCFFSSQFVEIFKYTNLGIFIANKGVDKLLDFNVNKILLILLFMIFSAIINLFIGGLSAKWAMLSPIFVPIFMKLNFSPSFIQASFRISDSVTNPISPLEPFMPYIISLSQKYNKNVNLATIIFLILPISIILFIFWTMLLMFFYIFNLPLGPKSYIFLN